MPYTILKVKGGYKVAKADDHSRVFSKKPFKTKKQATKQLHAIILSENPEHAKGGVLPFLSLLHSAYNLVPIRQDYSPAIKKVLNQYGNVPIQSITVFRKPIQKFVGTALNVASIGAWGRAVKKYSFDKVFHLYMIAYLTNGVGILIEKNEIINIKVASASDEQKENGQFMKVSKPINGLTINTMLERTKTALGVNRYWEYDFRNNNCQTFVKYLLASSNLIDNNLLNFVDQNVESIAKDSLSAPVQSFAKFTTTLASKLRTLTGRGLMLY